MGVLGGIIGWVVGFFILTFIFGAVLPNDWQIKAREKVTEHPRRYRWVSLFICLGCFFFSYVGWSLFS